MNNGSLYAQTIFEQFSKLNIAIVGDVMIDRYWNGNVSRISPEAPVPVVDWVNTEDRLGGAANVALNIKALGATPYLFAGIGKDADGAELLKLMNKNDLSTKGLMPFAKRRTTVKTRIMAGSQQLLRLDSESSTDLDEQAGKDFLENFHDFIEYRDIHVILFQDYNKGILTKSVIREVMLEALRRDIPTAVDPKYKNFFEYKRATLFKPNLKEMRTAVPFAVQPTLESLMHAAEYLRGQMSNRYTMITLSELGVFLDFGMGTEGGGMIVPTEARHVADVSGAGDTVISVAALGLGAGLPLQTMAILANLAGGQVCEKLGVVPVEAERLKKDFENKYI